LYGIGVLNLDDIERERRFAIIDRPAFRIRRAGFHGGHIGQIDRPAATADDDHVLKLLRLRYPRLDLEGALGKTVDHAPGRPVPVDGSEGIDNFIDADAKCPQLGFVEMNIDLLLPAADQGYLPDP